MFKDGKQYFENKSVVYKLDEPSNKLFDTGERIDLQELRNSSYDDTFISHLEKYFDQNPTANYEEVVKSVASDVADVPDFILDMELDSKADAVLKACMQVQQYREKYDISDDLSDMEVIEYIKSRKKGVDKIINSQKGGIEDGETQTEQTGEPSELSQVQSKGSQEEL